MLALRRAPDRPTELHPGDGAADAVALAALALAFLVALVTAGLHMPLRQNPQVLLFVALDAVLAFYLAVVLTVFQRHRELGALLALLIAVGLLAASCAKTLVLGESGFFADVTLVPDLLHVVDPVLAWLGAGAIGVVAFLYLGNFGLPRSRREACLVAPLLGAIVFATAVWAVPGIAAAAGRTIPVQARGFPTFGHFYTAYGGFLRDADWAHQMRAAATEQGAPAGQLPLARAVIPALTPRNIHLVVVESLTDPAWYPGFDLDVPLPPLFERWRGVDSRALSPVFGNRSSNAEFELLCGVPSMVGPSEIVFWRLPARPMPCLPRRLTGLGYRSVSLVPSAAEIFNAGLAYDAIGFERSLFDRDLDMSDLDGQFLSAESTLAQQWQALAPLIGTGPLLSYVFVNASHYPYALDQRRRPAAVQAQHAPAIMVDYANVISYAARAIDRFVARLQAGDPNGLIVILGDHAPPLGSNFLGYRKGGRIAAGERAPLRQAALYEVPLLVLDRGELLPVGRLPTYQIPYLLLDRLTEGAFCHRNGCAWDGQWGLRPFRDLILSFETHGPAARACAPASATEPCKQALEVTRAWQRELARMIGLGPVESRRTSMATPSPHGAP